MDFRISVIIPMYNSENTIIKALNSVNFQTTSPLEIIVVNDGSTDNSLKIVQNYIINNKNAQYILIDKKNGGVSSARNAGLKIAAGNWIALLDSDDEWLPNKLERQIEILNQNLDIDFLGTNRNQENFGKKYGEKGSISKISAKSLMIKNVFLPSTVIFKRKIIEVIGMFDESQRYAEEGNYFIRIANQFNCYLLNESFVNTGGGKAHFGQSGLSGNLVEMEKGELKNLKDALKLKIIDYPEYYFLFVFSLLKYLRRVIIVKFRK